MSSIFSVHCTEERQPVHFFPRHVAIEDVRQAQVSVGALAQNFRHGTSDRTEAKQSHVAVLCSDFLCSSDIAVPGGIAFRGTCHGSIIAEAEWRLPRKEAKGPAQAKPVRAPSCIEME